MAIIDMVYDDIYPGDVFYHNNFCVAKRMAIPDYMIVQEVNDKDGLVIATFKNHCVETKERVFLLNDLLERSNLNPFAKTYEWIFSKKPQKIHSS